VTHSGKRSVINVKLDGPALLLLIAIYASLFLIFIALFTGGIKWFSPF
jgi:hypothetical protein